MEIESNQSTREMSKEVKNALWKDVLTFLYMELFGEKMFESAKLFDGRGGAEIQPTDRIIEFQLESYELFFVRLNDAMSDYLLRNGSEMISREAEIKTQFVRDLGKLWWNLIVFNHPKELYGKSLSLAKGYKIIEASTSQNPVEMFLKKLRGE